jgi:hypothetical protein
MAENRAPHLLAGNNGIALTKVEWPIRTPPSRQTKGLVRAAPSPYRRRPLAGHAKVFGSQQHLVDKIANVPLRDT